MMGGVEAFIWLFHRSLVDGSLVDGEGEVGVGVVGGWLFRHCFVIIVHVFLRMTLECYWRVFW